MSLSLKSVQNYCIVNSFLLSLGFFQYSILLQFYKYNFEKYYSLLFTVFVFVFRNYILLFFIDYGTSNKARINVDATKLPIEKYKYEFHVNVATTTFIESLTHIFIVYTFEFTKENSIIWFIPISFYFEVVFDLFHYFSHRLLHHSLLYKHFHKKHHTFAHPISITTFYQDPIDLCITNSVPTILALYMTPSISYSLFHYIIVYKNFIEISGHCGKRLYPVCSFPQCIWLTKWLQIDLYAEDHDLHHSLNNCNYSKRFSLWDKMFYTYKSTTAKKLTFF